MFGFKLYTHHISDYMNRWILKLPSGSTVRLHHILRPDADEEMHDHPFEFFSLILWGGYVERYRTRGDSNVHEVRRWPLCGHTCRVDTRHKIISVPASGAWTLVFTGPKVQDWGFYLEPGQDFVPWREFIYLSNKKNLTAYVEKNNRVHGIDR